MSLKMFQFYEKLMKSLPNLDATEAFETDEEGKFETVNVSAISIPDLALKLGETTQAVVDKLEDGTATVDDVEGVNSVLKKVKGLLDGADDAEYELVNAREQGSYGVYFPKYTVPQVIPTTYRKGAKRGQPVNPDDVPKTWYPAVRRIDPKRQENILANRAWAESLVDILKTEYGKVAEIGLNKDNGTITLSRPPTWAPDKK